MVQSDIKELYRAILGRQNIEDATFDELLSVLKSDVLLERFAYRKQAGISGSNKEFIKLKGTKGQLNHENEHK